MNAESCAVSVRKKSYFLMGLLMCISGVASAEGQFGLSCHAFSSKLPYFYAECKGLFNTMNRTRININNYIGVESGELVWKRHGNFMHSSKLCSVVGTNLGCLVLDSSRKAHYSFINLDEHIGNFYGNLVYQGP